MPFKCRPKVLSLELLDANLLLPLKPSTKHFRRCVDVVLTRPKEFVQDDQGAVRLVGCFIQERQAPEGALRCIGIARALYCRRHTPSQCIQSEEATLVGSSGVVVGHDSNNCSVSKLQLNALGSCELLLRGCRRNVDRVAV